MGCFMSYIHLGIGVSGEWVMKIETFLERKDFITITHPHKNNCYEHASTQDHKVDHQPRIPEP
jgi:hypothetical protein